jgi:glycosyltransferase involved in cell wall biosynthesis
MRYNSIFVIHPSADLYGSGRILVSTLQAFSEETHKVVLLPLNGPLVQYLKSNVKNVEVIIADRLPIISRSRFTIEGISDLWKNYSSFKALFRKLNSIHQFELALINTLACVFVASAIRKSKVKAVLHCHEILESPPVVSSYLKRLALSNCDQILCVSNAVKNSFVRSSKTSDKLTVIHNGIEEIKATKNTLVDTVHFVLIGRFSIQKGAWFLLDAVASLPAEIQKNISVTLIGSTVPGQEYLKKDLQQHISKLGLQKVVAVLPFRKDLRAIMSKANVVVVPSIMADPFPTTVLEAMSASRPVITTDHGGAREAIVNGWSGVFVPKGNTLELAAAITSYVKSPQLIRLHGTRGRLDYLAHFTKSKFHKNLANYFLPEGLDYGRDQLKVA